MTTNKFTKIHKILTLAGCLCFVNANGQNLSPSIASSNKVGNSNYTTEQIYLLNKLLEQHDYSSFYEQFKSINVSSSSQIKYLEDKKYIGHVPLYWLMAEYYAQNKNIFETHKWIYIATIMTQQDSYLCIDTTSKLAPQKLLRSFPNARDLTNRTPGEINKVMPEVIFFIENLKTRTNPSWACSFGDFPIANENKVLISKNNWASTRARVFKNFTSNYIK